MLLPTDSNPSSFATVDIDLNGGNVDTSYNYPTESADFCRVVKKAVNNIFVKSNVCKTIGDKTSNTCLVTETNETLSNTESNRLSSHSNCFCLTDFFLELPAEDADSKKSVKNLPQSMEDMRTKSGKNSVVPINKSNITNCHQVSNVANNDLLFNEQMSPHLSPADNYSIAILLVNNSESNMSLLSCNNVSLHSLENKLMSEALDAQLASEGGTMLVTNDNCSDSSEQATKADADNSNKACLMPNCTCVTCGSVGILNETDTTKDYDSSSEVESIPDGYCKLAINDNQDFSDKIGVEYNTDDMRQETASYHLT